MGDLIQPGASIWVVLLVLIAGGVGTGITALVTRHGQGLQKQTTSQGQVIEGEAKFRLDLLKQIESQGKRIETLEKALEKDRERHDAELDWYIRWGTWSAQPPPRQPPAFVWPPVPGAPGLPPTLGPTS